MMLNSRIMALVFATAVATTPIAAQAQTAVGAGLGAAEANSASVSGAVSGAVNNNVFTSPANTTSRVSGTQTIRSVPTAISPGLAAAGIETCLGSVSVGASFVGGGFSFGSTVKDDDCNRRLYARQLYNMGFKAAAAVLQCITPEVNYAMAVAGTPCPNPPNMQPVSAPVAPVYGQAGSPPPGYAVNPAYLEWQRDESNRQRQRGRRSAALEAHQAPGAQVLDGYASARLSPGSFDYASR
jgi:hypothetical protein